MHYSLPTDLDLLPTLGSSPSLSLPANPTLRAGEGLLIELPREKLSSPSQVAPLPRERTSQLSKASPSEDPFDSSRRL
jgi:hypothetical protein